jgi:nicotinate-nucleotide adenylyltransferase
MRVGYFGGSFDPPHRGHLELARVAAEAFELDRVLFVPTSRQPFKPAGAAAGYADRLAMVRLLCEEANGDGSPMRFEASTLEQPAADDGPHYTVDTLERLGTELGDGDALFALSGADTFLQLPQWRLPERLLELAEWVVVSRPGFDLTRMDAALEPLALGAAARARIHLLPVLDDPTSATQVRNELAAHAAEDLLAKRLTPAVLAYIRERHLYEA